MNREELLAKIADVSAEVRTIADEFLDSAKDKSDVETRLAAKKEELRKLKLELTNLDAPKPEKPEERSMMIAKETLLKFSKGEIRSIQIGTMGGTINQIKKIVEEIQNHDEILNKATVMYGSNASTIIPVLTPPADPDGYAEGATNVSVDTTAEIGYTEIQPKCYASVLPVTAEQLVMGFADLETILPDVFAKVFRRKMHKGMISGNGLSKNMKGLFVSATGGHVTTLAATNAALKISDIAELAVKLNGLDNEYEIVIAQSAYQDLISDSTTGEDVKIYKEGLIRDKMIENIPVSIDPYAPYTKTTGQVLAVGVPLERYAIGVAGEINLNAIKKVGDTHTFIQAEYFFGGRQTSDTDIYAIVEG